jgi:ribose transport system substrate-binding protein
MNPRLLACLCGLTVIGLVACSRQPSGTSHLAESSPHGEATIGLSISTLDNPYFVALRDGARAEAQTQGLNLITVDAQDDAARQISNVEDLIQRRVSVILLNPTDSDAVANVVREANAAGIQVISLDRAVDGAPVRVRIASNNVAGGEMAAKFLLKRLGDKGNLVELVGVPGSSAARERGEGFDEVIKTAPAVKVVAEQPANFDRAQGLSVMENIVQRNRNIQGVFAQNDEMALGAATALDEAGLKGVAIIGFDATPDGVAAVKDGQLAGTIQQKPELIGKLGVDAAKALLEGRPVPTSIAVPLALITNLSGARKPSQALLTQRAR